MNVYQIVFSPTGGTQKVTDHLTAQWDAAKIDLSAPDFQAPAALEADALAFIAVPSFGGRVPQIAIDRLKAVPGNGARAVLVCVYGNRAWEDTLTELQDAAEEAGFAVVAAVAAVAEHSIFRQFAAGRPDAQDAAELTGFTEKILAKLAAGDTSTPQLEGSHGTYKDRGKGSMQPEADRKCNACGICAAQCPVGAIDPANPRKTDKDKCFGCMRCVSVCPQKSRGLNPVLIKGAGLALGKVLGGHKENYLYL